jgi:Stress responsive A/B Barrel Domain
MIRHDIVLRIKPGVSREIIDRTLRDVCDLFAAIPDVKQVRFGVNNAPAYRHALIAVALPDEAALHRFDKHSLHARAVRYLNRLAESTAVGSYLVGTEPRRG